MRRIITSTRFFSSVPLAALLACIPAAAQQTPEAAPPDPSGAKVHLELHDRQQEFKLGDLIRLDLVFTSRSPGYAVNTDPDLYLPPVDLVQVMPEGGTFPSHLTVYGQAQNGSFLVPLGSEPLRVPVLLNRSVVFRRPGHYKVTITTERLGPQATAFSTTTDRCDRCRTTNAVGIDLTARSEAEENALVRTLSNELDDDEGQAACSPTDGLGLGSDAAPLLKEMEALQKSALTDPKSATQLAALTTKLGALMQGRLDQGEQRAEAHREHLRQLAYLGGENAVRAKVHLLIVASDRGNETDAALLRDGLPDTRDVQLQYDLLHAAWRDPENIPTFELHLALLQARELANHQEVTAIGMVWAGTPQHRELVRAEFAKDFHEIVVSLPQRSGADRASTLKFLTDQEKLLSPADAAQLHEATATGATR